MREALLEWARTLCASAVVCCAALLLCPEGRVRRVLGLVCAAVMSLALLGPLASPETGGRIVSLPHDRERAETAVREGLSASERLLRPVIEERCAAYISDRARELGLPLRAVSVSAEWRDEDDCWIPREAYLEGEEACRQRLAPLLEAELGIPEERQYWNGE